MHNPHQLSSLGCYYILFFVISKALLDRVSFFLSTKICSFGPNVIQTRPASPSLVANWLDILFVLVTHQFPGRIRNNIQFLNLLLKQNIVWWQSLVVNSDGYVIFCMISKFLNFRLLLSTVIIKLLCASLLIQFFMNVLAYNWNWLLFCSKMIFKLIDFLQHKLRKPWVLLTFTL